MAAHSYWRIKISKPVESSQPVGIVRLELRSTPGGADQCTGGVASASSADAAHPASDAFDGNDSTYWLSYGLPYPDYEETLQYHFAAPIDIVEYKIVAPPDWMQGPMDWTFEFSDDGVSWTAVVSMSGMFLGASGAQVFSVPTPSTDARHRFWRINVSAANYANSGIKLTEVTMHETVGGDNLCVGGTGISSGYNTISYKTANAFDGTSSPWQAYVNPSWIGYFFSTPVYIGAYTLAAAQYYEDQTPSAWTFECSDDGIVWTVAQTVSGQTVWTLEPKQFTNGGVVTPPDGADYCTVRDRIVTNVGVMQRETITLGGSLVANMAKLVKEYLASADTLTSTYKGHVALQDTLFAWDVALLAKAFLKEILEGVAADDALAVPSLAKSLVLLEFVNTLEVLAPGYKGTAAVLDGVTATDRVASPKAYLKAIVEGLAALDQVSLPRSVAMLLVAESATLSDTARKALGSVVSELLHGAESVSSQWTGARTIFDSVWLSTSFRNAVGELLAESEVLADDPFFAFVLACLAADAVTAADSVGDLKAMTPVCDGTITISTTLLSTGHLNLTLRDRVAFFFTVKMKGDVYQAWSFSTEGMYPSLFTNYGFNSFAEAQGRMYGCREEGIYALEGDDDAGARIQTGVRLNYHNFGTHKPTSLYYAYFGLVGEKPVLKVISDHGEHLYYVVKGMARLPQGVRSHTWELVLTDIEALDFVEFTPIVLTR